MNSHLISKKSGLGVTNFRNSRAHVLDVDLSGCFDAELFRHNLHRPDSISASLEAPSTTELRNFSSNGALKTGIGTGKAAVYTESATTNSKPT